MKNQSFIMLLFNEEEHIAKCLESIKDYSLEIVVGNNQCTDNTIVIVKDFCKIHEIPLKLIDIALQDLYENGFAWAKNQLIEACDGNIIHVIDGDEELIFPSSFNIERDCYSITTRTFKNIGDNIIKQDIFFEEPHKRIFKKDSGIRYVGIIHEVLLIKGEEVNFENSSVIHKHYTEFKRNNKPRIRLLYSALLYKAYTNLELRRGISDYWFNVVVKNNLENIRKESEEFINNLKNAI